MQHLGTEHIELYVTPEEAMTVIPRLPILYNEPFSNSSQIPTYLASEPARRHMTVSLSGDDGDELFFGYTCYAMGRYLWRRIGWASSTSRRSLSRALSAVPLEVLNKRLNRFAPLLGNHGRAGAVGDKLHELGEILTFDEPEAIYHGMVSHWKDLTSLIVGASRLVCRQLGYRRAEQSDPLEPV